MILSHLKSFLAYCLKLPDLFQGPSVVSATLTALDAFVRAASPKLIFPFGYIDFFDAAAPSNFALTALSKVFLCSNHSHSMNHLVMSAEL